MRFELTVALKYLIPRWRQLSVSIISLLSVLVISLVVWLVVLFLSVTEGIEKRWIDELVSFNAPLKVVPTEEYYRSYYYLIDHYAEISNFSSKTIGEKLVSSQSDPYDPTFDRELPNSFPQPDLNDDGSLKDPVKEAWSAILSLPTGEPCRPQEYEVTFGNLRLNVIRPDKETFVNQVCYVSSVEEENKRLKSMLLPCSSEDYQNLMQVVATFDGSSSALWKENLKSFFKAVAIKKLQVADGGLVLPKDLYPAHGSAVGIALIKGEHIHKILLPESEKNVKFLQAKFEKEGYQTAKVQITFDQGALQVTGQILGKQPAPFMALVLAEKISVQSEVLESSIQTAKDLADLQFMIFAKVQDLSFKGVVPFRNLEIVDAELNFQKTESTSTFNINDSDGKFQIPKNPFLGDGILIAKHFQHNGVHLGDRGYLSYYSPTSTNMQEQRIPVYVAGFYDPGILPLGNKLIFVAPHVASLLRNDLTAQDSMLGNGIHVWFNNLNESDSLKEKLQALLDEKGIGKYWEVQSFHDYEFSKPILQQLNSDKNLFTLIAIIILIVACSNVISMLILLVNDKKKEIGIMQSMGASPQRIAFIFGLCGFTMGLVSCILGISASILTLRYLQSLVDFLSFVQGHEIFQAAFYGRGLPNEVSSHALLFVTTATLLISLLAGIIPAVKAARIRPTEILRSE